jgi:hypothetical protein
MKKLSFDKKSLDKFLTSKTVLNIVFIVSFINFISFIIYGKIDIMVLFVLIALITSNFSKNMIVVLLVPLVLANVYNQMYDHHVTEGLENNSKSTSSSSKKVATAAVKAAVSNENPVTKPTSAPLAKSKKIEESFDGKKKDKYNIDYASTVEEAYDNLNNILGGDNIKKLSSDTQGLVKQQLQLAEAMKGISPLVETMGPLLKQAEGLLGTMGGGDNINNIMKSLNLNKK